MSQSRAFNIPTPVAVIGAILLGVHAISDWFMDFAQYYWWTATFAFDGFTSQRPWSGVSYAALHGGWAHVGMNAIWLIAFGSPVAWRLGATRCIALFLFCAVAAALAHAAWFGFATMPGLIGASGAIAGLMGGACRFALGRGVPRRDPADPALHYGGKRLTIAQTFAFKPSLSLIVFWLALNAFIALLDGSAFGGIIGWQAHLGGFFAGLFAFAAFDPLKRSP